MFSLPFALSSPISLSSLQNLSRLAPSRSMSLWPRECTWEAIKSRLGITSATCIPRVPTSIEVLFVTTAAIISTVTSLKDRWKLAWQGPWPWENDSWCCCKGWIAPWDIRWQAGSIWSQAALSTWPSILSLPVPIAGAAAKVTTQIIRKLVSYTLWQLNAYRNLKKGLQCLPMRGETPMARSWEVGTQLDVCNNVVVHSNKYDLVSSGPTFPTTMNHLLSLH